MHKNFKKAGFILSTPRDGRLNINQNTGKICIQIYQEAEVCKVDNNNIKVISTVSSKNFIDYLRKAYFSKSLHQVVQNTNK